MYVIFPARFHNEFHLLVAFAWYIAAKVTEVRSWVSQSCIFSVLTSRSNTIINANRLIYRTGK
jgi:hypothetical protein